MLAGLDPSLVTPGSADTFVADIVEMDDPEALWESATTGIGLAHKWKGHVDAQEEARYLKLYCARSSFGRFKVVTPKDR
ncbi:MAG TPA: hypothetical protein VFH48_19140 [Chloroflexota bacterium]|nr:hypothetical protein [Chloroflexota bacterium]